MFTDDFTFRFQLLKQPIEIRENENDYDLIISGFDFKKAYIREMKIRSRKRREEKEKRRNQKSNQRESYSKVRANPANRMKENVSHKNKADEYLIQKAIKFEGKLTITIFQSVNICSLEINLYSEYCKIRIKFAI